MNKTTKVITIGREFGSYGKLIAKKVAENLNLPYYDKEILTLAAKESGFSEDLFIENDEKPNKSLLFSMITGLRNGDIMTGGAFMDMPLNHKLFLAQFETIKRIGSQGPCVIVGRCAEYVLRDNGNLFSVFIYGNVEDRIKNVMKDSNMDYDKAKEIVTKTDRQRASYYSYFVGEEWGDKKMHDLMLSTSKINPEFAAQIICNCVENK